MLEYSGALRDDATLGAELDAADRHEPKPERPVGDEVWIRHTAPGILRRLVLLPD